MIVLGVDPGTGTTGYGVVSRSGDGAVSLMECGVIRTSSDQPLPERLREIHEGIGTVIERTEPSAVAVESVFYARNVRTTLVLGHARGAILLAAALRDLPVHEYAPAEVKKAIAGTGRATKGQIAYMVQQLLRLKTAPRPADAADAVAIALTHCQAAAAPRAGNGEGSLLPKLEPIPRLADALEAERKLQTRIQGRRR